MESLRHGGRGTMFAGITLPVLEDLPLFKEPEVKRTVGHPAPHLKHRFQHTDSRWRFWTEMASRTSIFAKQRLPNLPPASPARWLGAGGGRQGRLGLSRQFHQRYFCRP
jgi:hypothetical protein